MAALFRLMTSFSASAKQREADDTIPEPISPMDIESSELKVEEDEEEEGDVVTNLHRTPSIRMRRRVMDLQRQNMLMRRRLQDAGLPTE